MATHGRRPGSAMGQVAPGQSAARRSAAEPALSPVRAGVIVAVLLDPPLLVQAIWQTAPATRANPLAVGAPGGPVLAACPRAATRGVAAGQSAA